MKNSKATEYVKARVVTETTVSQQLKELERMREMLADMELNVFGELTKEFSELPGRYGFASVDAFCAAVKKACNKPKLAKVEKMPIQKRKQKPQTRLTPEQKAEMLAQMASGALPSYEAAAAKYGLSLSGVYYIKKRFVAGK